MLGGTVGCETRICLLKPSTDRLPSHTNGSERCVSVRVLKRVGSPVAALRVIAYRYCHASRGGGKRSFA
jgi:hypothetical protein